MAAKLTGVHGALCGLRASGRDFATVVGQKTGQVGGLELLEDVGDTGLIPGLRTSPGEVNGNPLQYSCLENSLDRGAWLAIVHGIAKESDTT